MAPADGGARRGLLVPGLGASEEPPPSFDYSRASTNAFLDELLEKAGVTEPVVLVMHDIGGVIGIPWAAQNLKLVRGLVITNTVVFEKFDWFALAKIWSRTGALGKLFASAVMWQVGWFGGRVFRAAFARQSPELKAEDLDRVAAEFACNPKSKRSSIRLFQKMVPHHYFDGFDGMVRDLIARVPVRVVWGRGDPYIPARYSDSFPGAQVEIVEKGGHWIPNSSADRVAAAVRAVLAANASARSIPA